MSDDYHVMFDRDKGDWYAKKNGATRASARGATQREVTQTAKGFADRSGAEVNIHRKDNNAIRAKDTHGKPDRFPPRG